MKKSFKFYAIVWAVMLVIFNVVAFVGALNIKHELNVSFWIGYAAVTAAFIGQIVCAIIAFKADSLKKMFYNVSLITISYGGLIAMLIFGSLTMLIPESLSFIGIIACVIVLGVYIIAVVNAKMAADIITEVDEKVKTNTQFIRLLTADAKSLSGYAADDTAKSASEKVYEAVRYSDPVSSPALSSIESEISAKFTVFSDSVKNGRDNVDVIADELIQLINDRNNRCKMLK